MTTPDDSNNLLATTKIYLFNENLNLEQGRHVFKLNKELFNKNNNLQNNESLHSEPVDNNNKEKKDEENFQKNSCLLLTDTHHILCIGHNEYNEFGLSENTENLIIKGKYLINDYFHKKGLKAIKISSGARHTLILFDNGEVYCFGDNSDKQCFGFSNYVNEPIKIRFDHDCKIVDIQCGFNHSIVKSDTGKIYAWGDSSYGKCGYKENRIDSFIPTEIAELKIRNVIKIFAGPYQSAFFTSGGVVQ